MRKTRFHKKFEMGKTFTQILPVLCTKLLEIQGKFQEDNRIYVYYKIILDII